MTNFNGIAMLVASSGRTVPIEWAFSLSSFQFPVGMSVAWFLGKGDYKKIEAGEITRAQQREQLLEKAVQVGCEYAMFLDDDTISPAWTIGRLHRALANNPEAGVCGGIYCTKETIPQPLVFKELGGGPSYDWTLGDVFECKGLGTGCMMIRTSMLKDIPKPWFYEPHDTPLGQVDDFNGVAFPIAKESGTDDLFFCKKVTAANWKILAHGEVIPVHWSPLNGGTFHSLPSDTYPCVSFDKKMEEKRRALADAGKLNSSSDGLPTDDAPRSGVWS